MAITWNGSVSVRQRARILASFTSASPGSRSTSTSNNNISSDAEHNDDDVYLDPLKRQYRCILWVASQMPDYHVLESLTFPTYWRERGIARGGGGRTPPLPAASRLSLNQSSVYIHRSCIDICSSSLFLHVGFSLHLAICPMFHP